MNRAGVTAGTAAALQARMRGRVIDASDPGYDQARRVWNGAIDRHPAMIACCQDTADVVTAVEFGRAHGLPIAVRAGGHGVAGRAVCDGLSRCGPLKPNDSLRKANDAADEASRKVRRSIFMAGIYHN